MIKIDTDNSKVIVETNGSTVEHPFASPEAFALLSKIWLRCGWDMKHVYTFSWMGRPVIQLPEDMLRIQEVIHQVSPDVIIETGVAHGGSLIYYASLCKAMERGRVVGIDIEIRPHNRKAIEAHPLTPWITLIEGNSIAPDIVASVAALIKPGEKVLVLLDSCHSRDHVRAELEAYSPLVTEGSYIVATDGIMRDLVGAPRSNADWSTNNPYTAACEFVKKHPEFEQGEPRWEFDESHGIQGNITYWPGAYLRRRSRQ